MVAQAGTLYLIVGPSGVGKDTLMDGAKLALAGHSQYEFPARHITRPTDAGGEAHIAQTPEAFAAHCKNGAYILSWQAHGLFYGIPSTIEAALKDGKNVIINVSRSVIDTARALFPKVRIINISAPATVLRARLMDRGRETDQDIEERLARATAYRLDGDDVIELVNGGDKETAISKLVAILIGDEIGSF